MYVTKASLLVLNYQLQIPGSYLKELTCVFLPCASLNLFVLKYGEEQSTVDFWKTCKNEKSCQYIQ